MQTHARKHKVVVLLVAVALCASALAGFARLEGGATVVARDMPPTAGERTELVATRAHHAAAGMPQNRNDHNGASTAASRHDSRGRLLRSHQRASCARRSSLNISLQTDASAPRCHVVHTNSSVHDMQKRVNVGQRWRAIVSAPAVSRNVNATGGFAMQGTWSNDSGNFRISPRSPRGDAAVHTRELERLFPCIPQASIVLLRI